MLPTLCAFLFVSSKSLREISKAPTKSPKQAPSASLRMVYHVFLIACNARYSMPLRGVAASFTIMSLSALRGVDAQGGAVVPPRDFSSSIHVKTLEARPASILRRA